MKKYALIGLMATSTFVFSISSASTTVTDEYSKESITTLQEKSAKVDCTMKIKYKLEDGTEVTGTITVKDVSRLECLGMKISNTFSKIF